MNEGKFFYETGKHSIIVPKYLKVDIENPSLDNAMTIREVLSLVSAIYNSTIDRIQIQENRVPDSIRYLFKQVDE